MPNVKSARKLLTLGTCLIAMLVLLNKPGIRFASALKPTNAVSASEDLKPICSEDGFHPTARNRPVGPRGTPLECATFIDPTVEITRARNIDLHSQVYIAPFARLLADRDAKIKIEAESNVQDNVTIYAHFDGRDGNAKARMKAINLSKEDEGVEVAERSILAHGSTIKGPAKIGVGGTSIGPTRTTNRTCSSASALKLTEPFWSATQA